jgi:hypothetical protein
VPAVGGEFDPLRGHNIVQKQRYPYIKVLSNSRPGIHMRPGMSYALTVNQDKHHDQPDVIQDRSVLCFPLDRHLLDFTSARLEQNSYCLTELSEAMIYFSGWKPQLRCGMRSKRQLYCMQKSHISYHSWKIGRMVLL